MPKRIQRKPHTTNRKCDANTQQREAAIFFSSFGKAKSLLPQIYFQYIVSHTVYLNLGPLFRDICRSAQCSSFERKAKAIGPVCG